jgi:hypothetical protein
MFASQSLVEHLLRGLLGIAAVGCAVLLSGSQPWAASGLLVLGMLALRGCPMCWTIGLFETVRAKLSGKPSSSACRSGSCAR